MDKNNVDTAKELLTVISFCSGYGGIERGLDLAGVEHRVLAYVEIEAFAIANLVNKMENGLITSRTYLTRILKPSLRTSFEAALTLSLEATRASRFQQQVSGSAPKTPDTSGPTSLTTSRQFDLFDASSRTSKDTSALDLEKSLATWKAQVTTQRGEYSRRLKSAHLIRESGSTSWPTPRAANPGSRPNGKGGKVLSEEVLISEGLRNRNEKLWPTPATRDHHAQGLSHNPASRSSSLATVIQRENAAQTWLTPTVQDSKHSGTNPGPNGKRDLLVNQVNWQTPVANDSVERAKGNYNSRGEPKLSAQVKNWPTPSARDWKDSPGMALTAVNSDGSHRKRNDQLARAVYSVTPPSGSLNPDWVEWLMGVPTGWTGLDSWGTE
jgi:hypothetical protein